MKFLESKKLFFSGAASLLLLLFVLFHIPAYQGTQEFSYGLLLGSFFIVPAIWAGSSLRIECSKKTSHLAGSILFAVIPFFNLCLSSLLAGGPPGNGYVYWMNLLIYIMIQLFLFALSGSIRWAGVLSVIVVVGYNIINHLIVFFRGTPIVPGDFLSIKTAIQVAGNYQYRMNGEILFSILLAVLFLIVFWRLSFHFKRRKVVVLGICSSLAALLVLGGVVSHVDVRAVSGAEESRGVALDFYLNLRKMKLKKPEGYDASTAEKILEPYESANTEAGNRPNVIAIMNESFSDLSVLGEVQTNQDYLPFFKSLQKNTVRGQLLVSPFGGNTCNTEFEFLTGFSMGFLPQGSIPYLQYVHQPVDSLAGYFSALGYQTTAFHPYEKSCWNREAVYKNLGFDEFISKQEMESLLPEDQQKYIRNYLSDSSDYQAVIRKFEQKGEERFFLFNVTIQNHGGYEYEGENYNPQIRLAEPSQQWQQAEQYLSLMKESDTALKELISYFEKVNEPTVILLFGDHQPGIEKEFYEALYGQKLDTLTQEQLLGRYKIPFIIWANYDIEERNAGLTSPNYLSQLLLETAGLPQGKFHTFLKAVSEEYPAVNMMGFYDKTGVWHKRENNFPSLLAQYNAYEYHSLFSE